MMFSVEDYSHTHGLVEFIEEGCTAVIAMQCIVSNIESLESVSVLWNNTEEYSALYLLSGKPY